MAKETLEITDKAKPHQGVGVSIIMPVYNAAGYLQRSIRSITEQSFGNLELICIDDASSDDSVEIIESHMSKDQRIKLFRHKVNAGAPAARNLGIDHASGDYLMFMDADDALVDGAISTLFAAAADRGSDAVKGSILLQSADGGLSPHRLNQKKIWIDTSLSRCKEIQHLYQYQSYLFRATILREHNIRFETDLKNFQDPVFLSFLLPKCDRIDVMLDPVYIRVERPDSIITSRWKYRNFRSLIRGIDLAYDHLLAKDQGDAARQMALNITRWWYKFETMTEDLDSHECAAIFSEIHAFSDRARHPLYTFSPAKIGTFYYLSLITSGRYDLCEKELAKARKLSKTLPRAGIKLYDTARVIKQLIIPPH